MTRRTWLVAVLMAAVSCGRRDPYDVLIVNGSVVDGTGAAPKSADVAVRDGVIEAVGDLEGAPAERTIDASGKLVTPGFIDMMGGSSLPLLRDPLTAESKLRQGITTMMAGEGGSLAPQSERTLSEEQLEGLGKAWTTFEEYFPILEEAGVALNVVHNVGAAQVRRIVLGEEDVEPTPEQLEEMKELVAEAMEDGAVGLSSSLIYPPGAYASTEELIELARPVAERGGVYFTHMRNESGGVLEAIDEALRIGREANLPVHIYHLKAAGEANWPLMAEALERIQSAIDEGMRVTADIYPYVRNGIGLGSFLHPRHYARGEEAFVETLSSAERRRELQSEVEETSDWENWYQHVGRDWGKVLITRAKDPDVVGRTLAEVAEQRGVDPWDAFFDLVQAGGTGVAPESMNEEQKHLAMRAPFVCFDNDAAPMNPTRVASAHPRAFGAFPRILAKYVREENVLSMPEAIRKLTSLPADILGLTDRGRVQEGLAADLVVFDPERIQDTATFTEPLSYSVGVDFLLVNGELVLADGETTGSRPGRVLRGGSDRR